MSHELAQLRRQIEAALDDLLPATSELSPELIDAVRYAALDGGKRIRPLLVLSTAASLISPETPETPETPALLPIVPIACAVECIHSYSLIHDDLPAMDDDDLRHGKPSCHIAFDDPTAILAGDGLQAFAFELIANAPGFDAEVRIQMVLSLARAIGIAGMVGGQALDMAATGTGNLSLDRLQALHGAKTGALIRASVHLGALAGGANALVQEQLDHFADRIGLAFQVVDDILDVTQPTAVLGKPSGSDIAAGKATFPSLMGLDGARSYANEMLAEARTALADASLHNSLLSTLADQIVNRDF